MALKDWRKTIDNKSWIYWRNDETGQRINLNFVMKYFVDGRQDRIIATFKTKKQGLNMAKEYMRKH